MGDCVSKPEMDGRGKRQSPFAINGGEVQLEASLLPRLAVRHGVPYTTACTYGQGSAADRENEGATNKALVWRAVGGDVGSARYFSRHPTFAYLS